MIMGFTEIVIASTNIGKISEIKELLSFHTKDEVQVLSLKDYKIKEPDEPFQTFQANAIHKAKYYAQKTGKVCLAEDSGLCVNALDFFPGVRSKEFIEESGGILQAMRLLEEKLINQDSLSAFFQSAIAIHFPNSEEFVTEEAKDYGTLNFPARGIYGFGFDRIFIPDGYDLTFGEMGVSKKNKISHRAKALEAIIQKLSSLQN